MSNSYYLFLKKLLFLLPVESIRIYRLILLKIENYRRKKHNNFFLFYKNLKNKRDFSRTDQIFTRNLSKVNKPIVFIHIPKTAGTSFRKAAEIYYEPQKTCKDYGAESEDTFKIVHNWMLKNTDPWNFKKHFLKEGYLFFSGHVQASRYIQVFDIEQTVTFLRDPIQRIVSEFKHHVCHLKCSDSLENFYKKKHFMNKQHRMLYGVPWPALSFIGITERYDDSLDLFNNKFGVKFPLLEENLGKGSTAENHVIQPEQALEISEFNAQDVKLYAQVCRQFDWRLKLAGENKVFTRGMINGFDNKYLNGWAVYDAGDEPAIVDIVINDKTVGSVAACQARPYLKAFGIRRGGFVGFTIKIPRLNPGDEVSAFVADTGQPLANSPWRYPAE